MTKTNNAVLSTMLAVPSAQDAVAWYRSALGAEILWDLGGVAGLRFCDAVFYPHGAHSK